MIKILVAVVIGVTSGIGLGSLQSRIVNSSYEERFRGSQPVVTTDEEDKGEVKEYSKGRVKIVGGTSFNFGTMLHGETMSHEFTVRNTGTEPLSLTMGESSCTCTVGDLDKSTLNPGEETPINLTWTAKSVIPDFAQTASIHTNDPTNTEFQLKVMGQVARSFIVEPTSIQLGDLSANEELEKIIYIFSYIDDADTLESFEWSTKDSQDLVDINVEAMEVDAKKFPLHKLAKKIHRVSLTIGKGMPIGPLNSRVVFGTSSENEDIGVLEIPVTGRVVGDVTLFGGASFDSRIGAVDMGTIQADEGAKVTVWLAAHGAKRDQVKPEIKSILPAESVNVTIGDPKDRGKRRVFPIVIEVPKGAAEAYYPGTSGKNFGKILIETNLEGSSDVSLFLRLVVKK